MFSGSTLFLAGGIMTTNVGVAINGSGRSSFIFSVGTIAIMTQTPSDNGELTIDAFTPTTLTMGGADQNFPQLSVNEASKTPGTVALQIDVNNDINSSCFLRVPGAKDQPVAAGEKTRLIYVVLSPQLLTHHSTGINAIHEVGYEVRRESLQ